MLCSIVLNNASVHRKEGILTNNNSKPILPLSPIISNEDNLILFETTKRIANTFIVEESNYDIHISYGVARSEKEVEC
jgi:hypothetical protein